MNNFSLLKRQNSKREKIVNGSYFLTLSVPKFRLHLSSALFFFLNKLSLGKTFICKVDRLNVKQRRS